jgi:hypothetical protein
LIDTVGAQWVQSFYVKCKAEGLHLVILLKTEGFKISGCTITKEKMKDYI